MTGEHVIVGGTTLSDQWGILVPDDIPSARRLQTLGLTRAIGRFNERAVPGMGGLWFAMPLIWSMIGIATARKLEHRPTAQKLKLRPIEVANTVEALAMKLALDSGDGEAHQRVRGRRNLSRVGYSFEALRKPGAYITQPFRQTCTQALFTLGLVEGSSGRFNSFHLTQDGSRLLELLARVRDAIESWVEGTKRHDWGILSEITPTHDLPPAVRGELTRRIYGQSVEAERRKAIRDVGGRLTSVGVLRGCPAGLAPDHVVDLRGGVALVRLREAALRVLGGVEDCIARRRDDGLIPALALHVAVLNDEIRKRIKDCVDEAERAKPHLEKAREADSIAFLRDCRTADGLLQRLAKRDGVVIVLRDDVLAPGPAFGADVVADEQGVVAGSGVPELPRIAHLLALTKDLLGPTTKAPSARAAQ